MIVHQVIQFLADNSTPDTSGSSGDGAKIALYSLLGLMVTAALTSITQVLVARIGKGSSKSGERSMDRMRTQHEAWRLFLVGQIGVDPRKIKTGYETLEEVRRV